MQAQAAADPLMQQTRIRAGRLALAVGIVVLAAKLVAWRLTGSSAVFSDAVESVVNVVAGALLLYSISLSGRPADRSHPYGHGKVEFFSAGVEGTLIAVSALLIGFEAIRKLLLGPELERLEVGLAVVAGATLMNGAAGIYLLRTGRRTHSLALEADGRHLLTDVVTSVGVVVGLLAVELSGLVLLDPLIALLVAAQILRTGFALGREAVRGLMDEADPAMLGKIVRSLEDERAPWWIDAHSLRVWRSGAVSHADVHLVVPRYFDADRLHEIDTVVGRTLEAAIGLPGDAIAHFDPCRPRHCAGCCVDDCPVRASPFEARAPLTLERVTRGDESLETGAPLTPPGA